MNVCHIPWFRNKTGYTLTHFKKHSGVVRKEEKMLEVVWIYLFLSSRVQGVPWHALGSWVVRKQEKNGDFFTCDGSYLWAYCSEENALCRCHQFLIIHPLLAFCLHEKSPLTYLFTFISRSIHFPQNKRNKGLSWYFWTNTHFRVWRF